MKLGLTITTILFTVFVLTGCGIKTSDYAVSAQNVQKLRSYKELKLGINSFTAETKDESTVMCRAAETIETPKDESFEKYIENALRDELIMSGIYDENSTLKLSGHLKKIYASSMLGDAYWSFDIKVMSTNGKSIDLESKNEYGSAFLAFTACNNMGSSFAPSVKKLIRDILNHPKFDELIMSK
jgi:hypothetical protein